MRRILLASAFAAALTIGPSAGRRRFDVRAAASRRRPG